MILKKLETGPLMVNCYIVGDEAAGQAAVFDPGGNADQILKQLAHDGLTLRYIVNTHTHWDHTGGNAELQRATGAPILTHRSEAPGLDSAGRAAAPFGSGKETPQGARFVKEGDTIELGAVSFQVIDLRGHSPGGLGFIFEGQVKLDGGPELRKLVICGDALFAGSIGRTDFPGGDMPLLVANIRSKILSLPDNTLVLPGHGPISTVGREKQSNPFLRG